MVSLIILLIFFIIILLSSSSSIIIYLKKDLIKNMINNEDEQTTFNENDEDNIEDSLELINKVSEEPCEWQNYGVMEKDGKKVPWTNYSCRGIFKYGDRLGLCGEYREKRENDAINRRIQKEKIICPVDKFESSDGRFIRGLNKYTNDSLYLVKEFSDNKCIKGQTYGKNDDKTMYATNNCDGVFKFGPTIGRCKSVGNKQICQIGRTNKYGTYTLGLPVMPIEIECEYIDGTCYDREILEDQNSSYDRKCIGTKEVENNFDGVDTKTIYNYGIDSDAKNIWVKNNCKAKFRHFVVKGECKSYGDKEICPIGSTKKDTKDNTVGLEY